MNCTCALAVREATAPLLAEIEALRSGSTDRIVAGFRDALRAKDEWARTLTVAVDKANEQISLAEKAMLRQTKEIARLKTKVAIERAAADSLFGRWNEQKAEIDRLTADRDDQNRVIRQMVTVGKGRDAEIAELRDHLSMAEDVNRALRATLDGRNAPAGCQGAAEPQSPPAARSEALTDDPTFPRGDLIA